MRVLIVDDDPVFARFAQAIFKPTGIDCRHARSCEEALAALMEARGAWTLAILDWRMKDAGLELLIRLRGSGNEIPVIFVSENNDYKERVRGLDAGADDFLVKPVKPSELLARFEAVQRRSTKLPRLRYGNMMFDLSRRCVTVGNNQVELRPREHDLLLAIVTAGGKTLSKQELLSDVWERDDLTNVVEVHVGRLRRKLRALGINGIKTIRGQGYCFLENYATPVSTGFRRERAALVGNAVTSP